MPGSNFRTPVALALALVAPALGALPAARGADPLRDELGAAIRELEPLVRALPPERQTIKIGPITGVDCPGFTGTERLRLALTEVCARDGLVVRPDGAAQVRVVVRPVLGTLPGAEVTLVLEEGGGRVGEPVERTVLDDRLTQELFGPSASLPKLGPRGRVLREAITRPQAKVADGMVVAGAGDALALEVLVEGKPAPLAARDGLAVVELKRGQPYALRIHNRGKSDVGTHVSVDGIDLFTFGEPPGSDKVPASPTVIVNAGRTRDIGGWYRGAVVADPFVAGRRPKLAPPGLFAADSPAGSTLTVLVRLASPPKTSAAGDGGPTRREIDVASSAVLSVRILPTRDQP